MIVGHAALAFAVGAWAAHVLGAERERALLIGVAAGAFAVVPDVDMGYAVVGLASGLAELLAAGTPDVWALVDAFWDAGLDVHRGATHSLVVGTFAAAAFGLSACRGPLRLAGVAGLAGLVAAAGAVEGALAAGVVASFVLAGLVVAEAVRRRGLAPRVVLATALLGLLSHPFGDPFTGEPPPLVYPLDVQVIPGRLLLSSDPTLHLLAVFGLELATLWLAIAVYTRIDGTAMRSYVDPRAILGAAYAAAVVAIPPPTLEASYRFVFSVLAVGGVGATTGFPFRDRHCGHARLTAAATGLAAVSLALVAYGTVYAAS